MTKENQAGKNAMRFILLLGLVSLLGDVVYEGARSITGPYMAVLGASAAAVGIVAGLGELVGYALRLISGILTDKTGKYWVIAFIGYAMTFVAVPLLALAGSWQLRNQSCGRRFHSSCLSTNGAQLTGSSIQATASSGSWAAL